MICYCTLAVAQTKEFYNTKVLCHEALILTLFLQSDLATKANGICGNTVTLWSDEPGQGELVDLVVSRIGTY